MRRHGGRVGGGQRGPPGGAGVLHLARAARLDLRRGVRLNGVGPLPLRAVLGAGLRPHRPRAHARTYRSALRPRPAGLSCEHYRTQHHRGSLRGGRHMRGLRRGGHGLRGRHIRRAHLRAQHDAACRGAERRDRHGLPGGRRRGTKRPGPFVHLAVLHPALGCRDDAAPTRRGRHLRPSARTPHARSRQPAGGACRHA